MTQEWRREDDGSVRFAVGLVGEVVVRAGLGGFMASFLEQTVGPCRTVEAAQARGIGLAQRTIGAAAQLLRATDGGARAAG